MVNRGVSSAETKGGGCCAVARCGVGARRKWQSACAKREHRMNTRHIIGLSSGSSLDGVDAALVEAQGAGLDLRPRLAHFVHQDYPRDLRELLTKVGSAGA